MEEDIYTNYIKSCGNVFRDFNMKDPETLLLKSHISLILYKEKEKKKLSYKKMAKKLNLKKSDLKDMIHGINEKFEIEVMLECITKLNYEIKIEKKKRNKL